MALSRDEASLGGGDDLEFPTLEKAREANRAGDPQKALQIMESLWEQEGARSDPMLYVGLAVVSGGLGQLQRRSELLEEALQLFPDSPEVYLALGNVCQDDGEFEKAIEYYDQAIRCSDCFFSAHSNRSHVLLKMGRLEEALESCILALEIEPGNKAALINLASIHRHLGNLQETKAAYCDLLEQDPLHTGARLGMGWVLLVQGKADEAVADLLLLIAEQPEHEEARYLLGLVYEQLGDLVSAVAIYRLILEEKPGANYIVNQVCSCLQQLGMLEEMRVLLEKSVEEDGRDYGLLCNLASCYRSLGFYEKAESGFKRAIELDPSNPVAHQLLLFLYSIMSAEHVPSMLVSARHYWQTVAMRDTDVNLPAATSSLHQPGKPMRVGVITADLGDHPVSRFLAPFLEKYDREKLEVELVSCSRGFVEKEQQLAAHSDYSYSIQGLSADEARRLLRSREYDLILETGGFTTRSRIELLSQRCAPIQCHYIGYHATTGMPAMDYYIGDEETIPHEFADHFSERLWRIASPWMACSPSQPFPVAEGFATKEVPIFGSFNQISKLGDQTMAYWAAAMLRVPEALLILKDRGFNDEAVCELVKNRLKDLGVAEDRVFFMPSIADWRSHMAGYNMIDIALDTTPWSSATTAFDALGMGVPLAVIRGDTTSGRMSSSLVKALGKSQWIAESIEDYAAVVGAMAENYRKFRRDKQIFQRQVWESTLFDRQRISDELTSALLAMRSVQQ